jgi:transcriptional regulator with XRE-family HTH domain
MNKRATVTTNIKLLRQNKGWSQYKLALLTGLSLRTIQRAEKGQPTSTDTAMALAAVFEVPNHRAFLNQREEHATLLECSTKDTVRRAFVYQEKSDNTLSNIAIISSIVAALTLIILTKEGVTAPNFPFSEMLYLAIAVTVILISCRRDFFSWRYKTASSLTIKPYTFYPRWRHRVPGMLPYTSAFPLETNSQIIGILKSGIDKNCLLRHHAHNTKKNMLFIGEDGSGQFEVMLSQLFYFLCKQQGGVVLASPLNSELAKLKLKSMLKIIKREDDLTVIPQEELDTWLPEQWKRAMLSRQVIFTTRTPNEPAELLDNFFKMERFINEKNYEHEFTSVAPFLLAQDNAVTLSDDYIPLMQEAHTKNRTVILYGISDATSLLKQDERESLVYQFSHRFLQKIHNPNVAEKILSLLGDERYETKQDSLSLTGYKPGEATYYWEDQVWRNVLLTYIETPMTD